MPIIPIQNERIGTDVGVPQTNTNLAGAVSEAWGQFGQQLMNQSAQIYTTLKEQEAQDAATMRYMDDEHKATMYMLNLKNESPDGLFYNTVRKQDGTLVRERVKNPDTGTDMTITEHFRKWSNDMYVSGQKAMPSKAAQDYYTRKIGPDLTTKLTSVFSDELSLRHKNSLNVWTTNKNIDQNKQIDLGGHLPTMEKSWKERQVELLQKVHAGIIQGTNAPLELQSYENDLSKSMFQGYINQGEYQSVRKSAGRARYFEDVRHLLTGDYDKIKGTDGLLKKKQFLEFEKANGRKAGDLLDADTKNAMLNKIDAELQVAEQKDTNEYTAIIQNSKAVAAQGGNANLQKQNLRIGLNAINAKYKPNQVVMRANDINELLLNTLIGNMQNPERALKSRDEQIKLAMSEFVQLKAAASQMSGLPAHRFGASDEGSLFEKINSQVDQLAKERSSDEPAFLTRLSRVSGERLAPIANAQPALNTGLRGLLEQPDVIHKMFDKIDEEHSVGGNIGPTKLLPAVNAKKIAGDIKAIDGTDQLADTMKKLVVSYGPRFGQMMDDLIAHGDLDPSYKSIGAAQNSYDVAKIIASGINLKAKLGAGSPAFKEAKDKVFESDEAKTFFKAFTNSNPYSKNYATIREDLAAGILALSHSAESLSDGRGGVTQEAIKSSLRDLEKVHGKSRYVNGTPVLFPPHDGTRSLNEDDHARIKNNFESYFSPEKLKQVPELMRQDESGAMRNLQAYALLNRLIPQFEYRNGQYYVHPMFIPNRDGISTGQPEYLYQMKDGKPQVLEVPLRELTTMNPDAGASWDRFLGGLKGALKKITETNPNVAAE